MANLNITFLGTSSGIPTKYRNVSAIALSLPMLKDIWLFDCGEATQHQFLKYSHLNMSHISTIFITHMHGDHVLGLPGLISTLVSRNTEIKLNIIGPPGLKEFIENNLQLIHSHIGDNLNVQTVSSGFIFETNSFKVSCLPLSHRIPAFGYRIEEKSRPGPLLIEKLQADGIVPGPIYQTIKTEPMVTLEDGRIIQSHHYRGPEIAGKIVVYCTDTTYCENAIKLAENADLLIHEATYMTADEELAKKYMHSTAAMAAQVARAANVKTLALTHFSPRYDSNRSINIDALISEAQREFVNSFCAYDGLCVKVI